jgi:hypothetical protein
MNIYTPTRLYVKRHSMTGLRYFGKSIRKDIEKYKGSGTRWYNHIGKHGRKHVVTEWISDWFYDKEEIQSFAISFSEIFDIVESGEWANLIVENGLDGGYILPEERRKEVGKKISDAQNNPEWVATVGKEKARKISNTQNDLEWKETTGKEKTRKIVDKNKEIMNNPEWKATIGKESRRKAAKKTSETMNDLEWVATTGREASNKRVETYNDPEWKATVGEQRRKNRSNTVNDPGWLDTIGKSGVEKMSKTKNSQEWKESTGKESFRKRAETMNDPEWIKKNHKTCEYCNKTFSPSNYTQWHGSKCKLFK